MITGKLSKTDERKFAKSLQKLVALSGEPVEDIMRSQGRLFARDAAQFTERYGKTASGGVRHKQDVKKTILSTYKSPTAIAKGITTVAGDVAGKRFKKYIRQRNSAQAERMIAGILGSTADVGTFDGGKRHKARVKGKNFRPLVVIDWRSVTQYIARKIANVGEAKSGWAKAAEQLGGTRGIPGYAKKKHHKTKGRGSVKGRGGKAELTVENKSPYVFSNTKMRSVWKLRLGSVEKLVERMIKNRGRKITRRT